LVRAVRVTTLLLGLAITPAVPSSVVLSLMAVATLLAKTDGVT